MTLRAPVSLFTDLLSLTAQGRLFHLDVFIAEGAGDAEHDAVPQTPQLDVSQCLGQLRSVSNVPEDVPSSGTHQVLPANLSRRCIAVVDVTALETLWFEVVGDQRCLAAGTQGVPRLRSDIS